MKRIIFTNQTAQKIYDDYFTRVNRCIRILAPHDQQEMLMEFNSHIHEATADALPDREVEILVDTLERLGAPEVVLQPIVANKKVRQATRSFNPKHVLQALYLNIFNGIGYFVFAIIYLFIFCFGLLTVVKMIAPNHTGLFVGGGHLFMMGYMHHRPAGSAELLGDWFIATVIFLAGVFYYLNTLLLRLLKRD